MPAKWNFMVFMAGFNNLSPFAGKDLAEMQKVGSTPEVAVSVFIKQLDKKSAERLIVGKGKNEEQEKVGDADSGNPQTVVDFVRWAAKKRPAERYALVVWNHGSGWQADDLDQLYSQVRSERGDTGVTARELAVRASQEIDRALFGASVKEVLALPDARQRGIASDDGTGHSLDTIELNRVLDAVRKDGLGEPVELLGMDACLMSNLEVAYQARNNARVVVASEELEPGDGYPYSAVLGDLVKNPDMDGADLGKVIVKRYTESYESRPDQWPVTQCAVSASAIDDFAGKMDKLAERLRDNVKDLTAAAKIQRAQMRSVEFMGDLVDLNAFCTQLAKVGLPDPVKQAATAVKETLKPGSYVLAEEHRGPNVEGCGGVTVYFPSPGEPVSKYYKDLTFATQHRWDDFLRSYHRAIRGDD